MLKLFTNFRLPNDPLYSRWKEKFKDKPITLFYDYGPRPEDLKHNPYNFLMLHEPNEFFGLHTWALHNSHIFTGILTWNEELLKLLPNAVLFHHNSRSTSDEYVASFDSSTDGLNIFKKFEVSFLAGAKTLVEGHRFRQEIFKIKDQIAIPKKWYHTLPDFNQEDLDKGGVGRPLESWEGKKICFEGMFHVAVENVRHNNWYTEKIGEALCTKTVPIYWGAPNIGEFYDIRGIIPFETTEELITIVNGLTPKKYNEMRPYIDYNYEVARYSNFEYKLVEFFDELCKVNNI